MNLLQQRERKGSVATTLNYPEPFMQIGFLSGLDGWKGRVGAVMGGQGVKQVKDSGGQGWAVGWLAAGGRANWEHR